jgi:hypothetical protein
MWWIRVIFTGTAVDKKEENGRRNFRKYVSALYKCLCVWKERKKKKWKEMKIKRKYWRMMTPLLHAYESERATLWSSGQSSWLQIQWYRVRFPALPGFLRSSGSGTGSTQPHRMTEEMLEWKSNGSRSRKSKQTVVGDPLRWPRDTFYTQKLALSSPTSDSRSVGIVCLRTKATEFSFSFV